MTRSERSFTDDRLFVENFFRFLQDNEALDTALEELSILWNDDSKIRAGDDPAHVVEPAPLARS